MSKDTLLVVDDDVHNLRVLSAILREEGYEVCIARVASDALVHLKTKPVNLILFDLKTSGLGGAEFYQRFKETDLQMPFIVMTAYATVESAVEMMKLGAYDYLTKPLNHDELRLSVKKALEQQRLRHEVEELRSQLEDRYCFRNLVGKSKAMREIFRLIAMVAETDSTVLIQGETGTGKELVAKAIHYSGCRKDRPFIAVNCAAFPETLLESELFGHERGAFTGAIARKQGTFELANGGTLLLDEIDVASPSTQAELLRVLEEKQFRRVGGTTTIKVDVRLIAASNRSLDQLITDGIFRKDLFYRLNVIPISLPPLRDRPEDLPYLIEHFLRKFSVRHKKKTKVFSSEPLDLLYKYQWPGNVRELENLIDRLMVTCPDDVIVSRYMPEEIRRAGQDAEYRSKRLRDDLSLEAMEAELIKKALDKTRGSRIQAAMLLGISRKVLWSKMKRYGIT